MTSQVADYLRNNKQSISDDWERAVVRDVVELTRLDRAALLDHLPEVLDALAAWVEGQPDEAPRLFSALADGHAMQRLGFGIALSVLNIEYSRLRHVLLVHLLHVPSSPEVRGDLIRLNEGLDCAIQNAVKRYTDRRDHLRDRFIGILGHDLRNPLAAASFASNALAVSKTLGAQERSAVSAIIKAVARMGGMVNDLLDFARGQIGGGIPMTPNECDMAELCRAAAEEVRASQPGRDIVVHCQGDLRGTFDAQRVSQCLGNLLGNAVQHGTDPVEVTVSETDDRRAIVTRVTNRGKRLPPDLLRRCFEPFASSSEGARSGASLGLGLYIVSEIARAHGAVCEVTSSTDETAFTIRWPRVPRDETPQRP